MIPPYFTTGHGINRMVFRALPDGFLGVNAACIAGQLAGRAVYLPPRIERTPCDPPVIAPKKLTYRKPASPGRFDVEPRGERPAWADEIAWPVRHAKECRAWIRTAKPGDVGIFENLNSYDSACHMQRQFRRWTGGGWKIEQFNRLVRIERCAA